jgi:hypothetical protein
MDCDLPDDWPTLAQVAVDEQADPSIRRQAMRLIKQFGFKESDKLCEEVFISRR